MVEAAVESIAPAAQAKGISLRKSIGSPIGPVLGDNNRLQQIVWNLLSNAVKFTPRNGNVDIIVERVESHLQLTVKTRGPAFDPTFCLMFLIVSARGTRRLPASMAASAWAFPLSSSSQGCTAGRFMRKARRRQGRIVHRIPSPGARHRRQVTSSWRGLQFAAP